ncbi:MAG: hypothetical protein N2376_14590 [Clostridia bacterium]|nr:hypothetical protein [Clostridia bacterium]
MMDKNDYFYLFFLVLCILGIASWLNVGWCSEDKKPDIKTPSLSQIIFFSSHPAKAIEPERYHGKAQACIRKYLDSVPPGSYLWQFDLPFTSEKATFVRRRVLAEQIVVILGEKVRTETEAFAFTIPMVAEWEGMSEGPVQEANFIDLWLKEHPGTSTEPFLQLLKAHRLRAGFEAARARQEKELWPVLKKRYREALSRGRLSNNPLLSCLAEDLESQPYVYLEGQGRP